MPTKKVPNDTPAMIIMMALNVLREAKDTAGRVRVLYASRPRVKQLGGRYFLFLETKKTVIPSLKLPS